MWYRLSIVSTCDVYLFVKTNHTNTILEGVSYTMSSREDYKYVLDYDPLNSDFEKANNTKFEISNDFYHHLSTENPGVGIFSDHIEIYENTTVTTIGDKGVFGLFHGSGRAYETLDLTNYTGYMSSDFIFTFHVTINLKEENDGYQEVLLYDNCTKNSDKDNITEDQARTTYGLLDWVQLSHGPGTLDKTSYNHEFTFTISGDKVLEYLYIKYDASGKYEDTWHRNSILVELSISRND